MKVLLAYDGMDHDRPALEEAAQIVAENPGSMITVMSVVSPKSTPSTVGHVPVAPHAHTDAAAAHDYLKEHGGIDAEMKLGHGDPAKEIVDEARTGQYDVIVTGTHGRGALGRLAFGSVSREIAETAPCTVLIVSPDHRIRVQPRVIVEPRASTYTARSVGDLRDRPSS
jgi:nucleotide-binding universal stress UspA family protein